MQDLHTPDQIRSSTEQLSELFTRYYSQPEATPVLEYRDKTQVIADLAAPTAPQEGLGLQRTLELFEEKILKHSVKTWHPAFFNQMSAGASFPAVVASSLAAMINGTLSTFEASPAATVIERNMSEWMANLLGMKAGSSGIFLPGSSLGNFLALAIARNTALNPNTRTKGLQEIEEQGVVLCSEAAHYSISNAVNLIGLGSQRLLKIKTNARAEMEMDHLEFVLEECRTKGLKPFAIVATLGATVTGGFDPLEDIVALCKPRGIHVHVDAAFGGGMALTEQGSSLFQGIQDADTVTWDAHKWFHAPLTCSVLLAPDDRIFKNALNSNASYLFHHPDQPKSLAEDLGQYSMLCGKQFHGLVLWMLLHTFGERYLRQLAEERLEFLHHLASNLDQDPDFELPYQPLSPVLCFRFLPEPLQHLAPKIQDELQEKVRQKIHQQGSALFNIAELHGAKYFRFILINPLTTLSHMELLLEEIRAEGWAFAQQQQWVKPQSAGIPS